MIPWLTNWNHKVACIFISIISTVMKMHGFHKYNIFNSSPPSAAYMR